MMTTIILCNRVTILYSYKLYIEHAWGSSSAICEGVEIGIHVTIQG